MKNIIINIFFGLLIILSSCGKTEENSIPSSSFESTNSTVESSAISTVEKMTYTIEFDLNGGTSASYDGSKVVESFSKDIFFFDCVKEGYIFRGWTYEGVKIFDEKGNQLSNLIMTKRMTFLAIFSQNVKLTIQTNMPEAGEIKGAGEYGINCYAHVSATPYENYRFVGWYSSYQKLLSESCDYDFAIWNEDVVIFAKFAYQMYSLTVRSNNSDCGLICVRSSNSHENSFEPSFSYVCEPDNRFTVIAQSTADVLFLGWYDGQDKFVSANPIFQVTMPSHDYNLIAKWNRFSITYDLDGGINSDKNPSYYSMEDEIFFLAPKKEGYTFLGWYDDVGKKMERIEFGTINDIILKAKWSPILNHLVVVSEDASKGSVLIVSGQGYTDEQITIKATPATTSYFTGWFEGLNKLSDDETYTFKMLNRDLILTAHFITKAEYQ